MDVLHVAIEGQLEICGIAKPAAMLDGAGDLKLDLFALHGACQPRDRNFLDAAGRNPDHLARAQGGKHLGYRQRAGGAEIGRAIDRDLRRGTRVVDDVADPHHLAGHGDIGAKCRHRDGVGWVLRRRRRGAGREQGGGDEERASSHLKLPHRNSAEVVCIIWSAAPTTLAFIS